MQSDNLQVRLYEQGTSSTIVQVLGEVDIVSISPFTEALAQAVAGERSVIVDLTDVLYIDTAGLQELVNAHKKLLARQGELILVVKPNSQPEYVIHTVLLDSLVTVFQSLSSAIHKAENASAS